MYEFTEEIPIRILLAVVFGYGLCCSILIDLIVFKLPRMSFPLIVILYIAAGYIIFILSGINFYTLFAGTIGAICSLLFYFGTNLTFRYKFTKFVFSFFVPITLIILMNIDFTEKEQWNEVTTDSSFAVSFDHFNGKHEIPVQAKEGQIIAMSINFTILNGGGHGYHVLNEKGKLIEMKEVGGDVMGIYIKDSGVYRLVVTRDDAKGSIKVTWSIGDSNS